MTDSMRGKLVLLTGATEGIGKAAALGLARRGAELVLVGRSAEKTDRVVQELRAASGNASITSILADLSLVAGVRTVAEAFRARHARLDVLVNNAGAVYMEHELTAEGFERTFALNHLSYFVLTEALRDVLTATPGARVVSTSSDAHRAARLDLATVARRPDGSAGFPAYADSKAANILFTLELGRRLEGSGVTAHCYHPGWVSTGFALNNQGFMAAAIGWAAPLLARTPEKGAETLVWLASSPEVPANGGYFKDLRPTRGKALVRDEDLARRLWALSEELVAGVA